ncbi:hypothetical protein ACO0LM_07225 [Undibacterium sp. Di26W]|uniref:hypothetical protein n=1 Tax=Undibacterium sp. Di26W TaxID=3413035 RepID=UPI003BF24BF1
MRPLQRYRNNRDVWLELAPDFVHAVTTDDETIDINAKQRYFTLIGIQYDFQECDKELVRYLFQQEISSLINDDSTGTTDALLLGAYLLARYQDPIDIPLLHEAKHIDMDTGSGFDIEFMYWALKSQTHDYVRAHFPDLYEDIKDQKETDLFYENLDSWWLERCSQHPANPTEESDYAMYERHLYFGDLNQARKHVENWARNEVNAKSTLVTLKYAYKSLGEYQDVIEILKIHLSEAKAGWDKVSVLSEMLETYVELKSPPEAFACFAQIDAELSRFHNWKDVGLGRILVCAAFEYIALCENNDLAMPACKLALSWFRELTSHTYVLLIAGEKATRRCQILIHAEKFRQLAEVERKRIGI